MSNTIREYESMDLGHSSEEMHVTAFVGKGHSVQFTIGMKYCALSEKQVKDLIEALTKRINLVDGYTATGEELDDIRVTP